MRNVHERQERLLARCSKGAAEYLLSVCHHPLYIVLIGRLERLPGALFQLDIEQTFSEIVKRYPLPDSARGAAGH